MEVSIVKKESKASIFFDIIRFMSAFIVVIFHGGVEVAPGYEAVMIFFVLSGLFISGGVIKSISEDKWSWKIYLINRLSRLWVVLVPALLLAYVWAKLSVGYFGGEERFIGVLNWKVFLGNLFFLQGITTPIYGLNTPLWSLSYEFWYYILFPCIVQVIYSKKIIKKIIYFLVVILIAMFVGQKIMQYFPIWLLGTAIVLIKPKRIKNAIQRKIIIIFSIMVSAISINLMYILYHVNHPNGIKHQLLIDYIVGISIMFLFYIIMSLYNNENIKYNRNTAKIAKYLAGFSYTLYLTHYPLLQFIMEYKSSESFNINKLILMPITLVSIILYAIIVAKFTENNMLKVRKFLSKITLKTQRLQKN